MNSGWNSTVAAVAPILRPGRTGRRIPRPATSLGRRLTSYEFVCPSARSHGVVARSLDNKPTHTSNPANKSA